MQSHHAREFKSTIVHRLWHRYVRPERPLISQPVADGEINLWQKFKRHRTGYYSLIIFSLLFVTSLFAELVSNDKPLLVHYQNEWHFPIFSDYAETDYGGVLRTPANYHDPFVRQQLAQPGNFAIFPLNPWDYRAMNYWNSAPHPAPPSADNWLGTDIVGRDVAARLLYAFRLSVVFGLLLTVVGCAIGIVLGAIQGYFGGTVDLVTQRLIEIWGALPELYLLIIFASLFEPSLLLLFVLLSLFGWMLLADYVRAEFLRNRQLEYVTAARAMGLSNLQIIWRHVLPNSLVPVITFLPFRVSAAIMALTSLDFLGLGVPAPTPSLGELLAQGKTYLYAWWISIPTFCVLVLTLLLLTFIGDGLRDALDSRRHPGNGRS
jgi:microcin C transport system permease protein